MIVKGMVCEHLDYQITAEYRVDEELGNFVRVSVTTAKTAESKHFDVPVSEISETYKIALQVAEFVESSDNILKLAAQVERIIFEVDRRYGEIRLDTQVVFLEN